MGIDKGQVFVRGINADAKWDSIDALDLTEESFRRFVLTKLNDAGLIVSIRKDATQEDEPLYERREHD